MADLRKLVRWNDQDARAIADQLSARMEEHLQAGRLVGVVACIVSTTPDGGEKLYEPAISLMPPECMLWAAKKIERRAVAAAEEEE